MPAIWTVGHAKQSPQTRMGGDHQYSLRAELNLHLVSTLVGRQGSKLHVGAMLDHEPPRLFDIPATRRPGANLDQPKGAPRTDKLRPGRRTPGTRPLGATFHRLHPGAALHRGRRKTGNIAKAGSPTQMSRRS
ncbi:hypothetical protein IHE45_07G134600 [Dioscorea alata]|uniref:Uncharacterized protein n=1 Tax=Dioscorea alata TaxID=55571 RepID=A0ACB7VUC3_DIOAL|nr:hypothetical protein IHE45_07G134600 [Dioscorea alata]